MRLFSVTLWILSLRSMSAWLSSSSKRQHTSAAHGRRRRHDGGTTSSRSFIATTTTTPTTTTIATRRHATPIMDAEFERVQERNQTDTTTTTTTTLDNDDKTIHEEQQAWGSKSLLQVALESEPEWNETRIPFLDGPNFIDVKLAFMAELDGVQYGIGIPFDHAAAVTIEQNDGTVVHLSPDDKESEEMIKIMADQLQEHVGKDLKLKMTPRVLTIQGPLEKYTANWRETLVPQPLDTKTLLDDSNEDLQSFHDFMKKELGEEEYTKTMNESPMDVPFDIMDLFGDAMSTSSSSSSSPPTVEDLLSSFNDGEDGEDLFIQEMQDFVNQHISHDGVALKLISYSLQDGNKYSVVQPLQPLALVAKYTQEEDDVRFDLLSPEDAELLIPRLEDACRQDLQKAGLTGEQLL